MQLHVLHDVLQSSLWTAQHLEHTALTNTNRYARTLTSSCWSRTSSSSSIIPAPLPYGPRGNVGSPKE